MKNLHFKVVMGFITLLFVLIIGTWICAITPININRKCYYTSFGKTPDNKRIIIDWVAKYGAPINLPAETKEGIEGKIFLYGQMRLRLFLMTHDIESLTKMNLDAIQKQFDNENIIGEMMKMSPELQKKLKLVKSVKILSIKIEKPIFIPDSVEPLQETTVTTSV